VGIAVSSTPESLWTGGGFLGADRSVEFVDRSRPEAVIKIMNVDTPEQAERVLTEYYGEVHQFWRACDTLYNLSQGDHQYFRKRVREIELVYVTQAGQPYLEVWPDPVEPPPRDVVTIIEEIIFGPDPGKPILIERVRKGFVIRFACYESPINENNFTSYPPSLWFTRSPPISPMQFGPPAEIDANVAAIQAAYAALSPEDAEIYQLSRIIVSPEFLDQNDNPRKGYVTLGRFFQPLSQSWEERPEVEFEGMGLLPIEPDAFGEPPIPPWFPDNYSGPWAPPISADEARDLLISEPATYNFWPNGTSANLYDFFGAGAPPFQGSITDSGGQEQFFDLGVGSRFNADPQGMPDEALTTCGFTFEETLSQDDYGHPLEDNQSGIQESRYWPFAPLTFWRPDGTEIVGPYPLGSDGFIPQDAPFEPMSDVSDDFLYWLGRL
jgi:hypothetical protein